MESIPLHPLYRSICVHCTQYVHPLYPLVVFCPLDLIIYASMVPAYHLMSTVSVRPLFLYCVHCLVSVQLYVSCTCGCGLLSDLKGCVIFMVGRRKLFFCSCLFCFSSVTFLLLLLFLTGSFQNNVSEDKPVESSSHSPAPKNNEKLSSDGKKEDKPLTAGTEE